MFIQKIKLLLVVGAFAVAGCTQTTHIPVSNATDLGENNLPQLNSTKTISVVLPESAVANDIRRGAALAFISARDPNINVRFTNIADDDIVSEKIEVALDDDPDFIIGPLTSENVKTLRGEKSSRIPAITFTSDVYALGDNVSTMSLIPTQSADAIVKFIASENKKNIIIFAPDDASGHTMANTALNAADIYKLEISGFYYYKSGDMESLRNAAQNGAMFNARENANTRAREILSDALMTQNLDTAQKLNLNTKLEKLNKTDTIGNVPYNAVLFLGNVNDSRSLGSFLRYFDVPANRVSFYGTAMWDNSAMMSDMIFSGARFSAMPAISQNFADEYKNITGDDASIFSALGYDASTLAIASLHNDDTNSFLTNPSGFRGATGLIKINPSGTSVRALEIRELNGTGVAQTIEQSAQNFINPIYSADTINSSRPNEIHIATGINPMDYLNLSDALRKKYKSKTFYQTNDKPIEKKTTTEEIIILPNDDNPEIAAGPDFKQVSPEPVQRTMIDAVSIR
ncbi:MAG: penicillin-binding protein activator [Rickettsiales bacterium]|jgi:outer membrane PBP1 activator LpoA protein|nr:penicillin-binding protein activator [Rickettsiales bacterium]